MILSIKDNYLSYQNMKQGGSKMKEQIQIKDNSIIILPHNIKNNTIKEIRQNSPLLNVKFMSIDELISSYLFNYDEKTIYYLINEHHMKYEIAIMYLKNLYYIDENKQYQDPKLKYLKQLKEELINNDLLIFDDVLKNYLQSRHLIIYGYNYLSNFERQIVKEIDSQYEIITLKNKEYSHQINEFNTIQEEVEYVASCIVNLINEGININNIKLTNVSAEYYNIIMRIFKLYNLPIENLNKTNLYSTTIGKFFLDNFQEDITITLKQIEDTFNLSDPSNNNLYNQIVTILNKYSFTDNILNTKEMIIYDFKNTYISQPKYEKQITVVPLKNNYFTDEDYLFLLDFTTGTIPRIYKDEDYLNDKLKEKLNLETTITLNTNERQTIINIIKNIKNLTITYKLNSNNNSYIISNLNEELDYPINKPELSYKYSHLSNKIKLTNDIDNLIKYNSKSTRLSLLHHNYQFLSYKTYNNQYTGIVQSSLLKYIDNKLLLSYSSIDNYYRCGFRYYINNILKLSIYENTFMTVVGNIFHYVLSIAFKDNFDLDTSWNKYLSEVNYQFSAKEKFFLKKLKKELIFIIDTIQKQYQYISLKDALYEEKIYTNVEGNINITFMGIVDKLLYKEEDNHTLVAIIDYKTGHPSLNLNTSIYGIGMQLPVYIYLAKNTGKLKNVIIGGFYLQSIVNNEITKDYKNDYLTLKENNLKLQGYSNNNEDILSQIDSSYSNSQIIKSMKTTNKGFSTYAKLTSNEEIDKLAQLVEDKIKEASREITNANFAINPKQVGDKNLGCEFCQFKDICHMTTDDIQILKEYHDLSFLREEDSNANMDERAE